MLELLEQQGAGPFRDHEAVPILVERARSSGRVLRAGPVPAWRRTRHRQPAPEPPRPRRSRSRRHRPGGSSQRPPPRRRCRSRRRRPPPCSVHAGRARSRCVRRGVGQHVLMKVGLTRRSPRSLRMRCCSRKTPAHRPRSEDHADVVEQAVLGQPGVGECPPGPRPARAGIAVHPAQLLRLDPAGGIEALLPRRRSAPGTRAGVEVGDLPTPDWPSSIAAQVLEASRPTGVTAPTPVTTTRFIPTARG